MSKDNISKYEGVDADFTNNVIFGLIYTENVIVF